MSANLSESCRSFTLLCQSVPPLPACARVLFHCNRPCYFCFLLFSLQTAREKGGLYRTGCHNSRNTPGAWHLQESLPACPAKPDTRAGRRPLCSDTRGQGTAGHRTLSVLNALRFKPYGLSFRGKHAVLLLTSGRAALCCRLAFCFFNGKAP